MKIKYVSTGEIFVGKKSDHIYSTPLGSCVALAAYDTKKGIAGMAHIMLPGKSPEDNSKNSNIYGENAISNLLRKMQGSGARLENIEICLAGGANVLKKKDDTVSKNICERVKQLTMENKLTIKAESLGGTERRSLSLKDGKAYLTIGDDHKKEFYIFDI